ncbi:MAG TPA: hypothetical protein VII63_08535 [Caulobacteraceae bacterium]
MSKLEKQAARVTASPRRKAQAATISFKARPCGDIDYAKLAAELRERYPKILARLAE